MPAVYDRERTMWRVALVAAAATLLTGCGGSDGGSVERSDFIVELENSIGGHLEEPTVYGQAGLTPTGAGQTRIVIKLDEPFAPAEAEIYRGGCNYFQRGLSMHRLGLVEDGELEAVVDAPLRELRQGGIALIVRGPYPSRDPDDPPRGTCGDLSTAEPTDDSEL
jgi:hypothetical protein